MEGPSRLLATQPVIALSRLSQARTGPAIFGFDTEPDDADAVAEDLTREALDAMGVSGKRIRVAGTIDSKRARLIFHPQYAVRQALLIDAKAEKDGGKARIQTAQTSLRIQRRTKQGAVIDEQGTLPQVVTRNTDRFITTTIFAKFFYKVEHGQRHLKMIRVACLPNGMLQNRYNPGPDDTIWSAGPHSPKRREKFRTRLNLRAEGKSSLAGSGHKG